MIQVSWAPILLSAVAAMGVGSVWYGPLFGKSWMSLVGMGKSDINKKEMPKLYGIMFLGAIVEAYILSHFIHYAGAVGPILGAKTGLWAWLGFVATTMIGNYLFAKRPMKLYYIDAGYALVNLLMMGAVIGLFW